MNKFKRKQKHSLFLFFPSGYDKWKKAELIDLEAVASEGKTRAEFTSNNRPGRYEEQIWAGFLKKSWLRVILYKDSSKTLLVQLS